MSGIEGAADAWAAGDRLDAFEALCGLWAQTQHPGVAELCEQISEQLVRERLDALELEHGRERVQAELIAAARAGDRIAVHALLPWLVELPRPKGRQKLAMLEVADPVQLRWVIHWYRRRPELNELPSYIGRHYTDWCAGLYVWCERDASEADRQIPRFARVPRMAHVRVPRPARGRGPTAAELAGVAALRACFEADLPVFHATARALLDAVHEDPDDDGRRAVLADFLLEHGRADPRGEFICLQLRAAAGPLPNHARERERELLDLHGLRWLGPFALICNYSSVRFERGFLTALDLHPRPARPGWAVLDAAPGDAIWSTIERVNNAPWSAVGHPITRALRELGCNHVCAESLLRGPIRPRLERLTVTWSPPLWRIEDDADRITPARAAALLAKLDAVPNLRHLGIRDAIPSDPEPWQWLWQGPRARLESIRLRLDVPTDLSPWIVQLRTDGARVELQLDHRQLHYVLDPSDGYRAIRVTHNVPRWRELTREPMLELLLVVLASTLAGAGIDRIEVDPAVVSVDELGRVLRGRGVELEGIELVSMAR